MAERLRVLFVGNSYTFYNDMPDSVVRLAQFCPGAPSIEQERVVEGGSNLKKHWEQNGGRERVVQGAWDYVVIQEKSTGPLHDRERFLEFGGRFAAAAHEAGAQPLLYLTWARAPGHPVFESRWSGGDPAAMNARLREAYEALAVTTRSRIVPVGPAWAASLGRRPELTLHDVDLHHASPAGSFLAACCFFGALTGLDPRKAAFSPDAMLAADGEFLRETAFHALAPASPAS